MARRATAPEFEVEALTSDGTWRRVDVDAFVGSVEATTWIRSTGLLGITYRVCGGPLIVVEEQHPTRHLKSAEVAE